MRLIAFPALDSRSVTPTALLRSVDRPAAFLRRSRMPTDDAKRYRANLQGEVDSAAVYRAMADAEPDPKIQQIYRRLAAVEEAHAEFWRKQLTRIGARINKVE